MNRRCLAVVTALLLTTIVGASTRHQDADGFIPLVEGTEPGQFALIGLTPDSIRIEDGVVMLTGKPNGYFATKADYSDYVLSFDWKYDRPDELTDDASFDGNSGLLLHISGEHKVWPKCVEAQLQFGDAGHVFAINGSTFKGEVPEAERKAAQKAARKPVGEWNEMEVVCRGDRIECKINGKLIDQGVEAAPARGPIGWQSEGRPISIRNIRLKPLR